MKPYLICHMFTSVDGRILPYLWHPPLPERQRSLYEQLHNEIGADGWLVGRVTGAEFATRNTPYPTSPETFVERENWFADTEAEGWAVVLDASGKIAWGIGDIGGDPLLVVLTEKVSDSHLAGLRADGVSYIFAGAEEIDLALALETLNRALGIERLLLEGGGGINGAFLQAGLLDELSVIVAPTVEGIPGGPALFDTHGEVGAMAQMGMALEHCQVLEGGCVWLRYRFSWGNP